MQVLPLHIIFAVNETTMSYFFHNGILLSIFYALLHQDDESD